MTHRVRMLQCMEQVDQLTAEIEDWEQKTRQHVITRHAATLAKLTDPLDQEHVILFHMNRILEKKLVFQKKVRALQKNITLAQMHGTASLVLQGGRELTWSSH
jgi:peptidoglycan hydrolase CwlO-like protein